MGRLVDEAQRLLPGAHIPVQLQGRGAHQEKALGGGRHQRGEVDEFVRIAECAVGAVRGEHLHHGVDIVLGHTHGIAGQQLLELDDVGDGKLPIMPPRIRRPRGPTGLVGTA